jgi:hypothetical protein
MINENLHINYKNNSDSLKDFNFNLLLSYLSLLRQLALLKENNNAIY